MILRSANRGANDLRYRVNNEMPNQLTEFVHDQQNDLWMRNHALYVQEQWTLGRLTLQGALRYDRARVQRVIDAVFPLAQAREAVSRLLHREQFGKIVLVP